MPIVAYPGLAPAVPEVVLVCAAMALLIIGVLRGEGSSKPVSRLSVAVAYQLTPQLQLLADYTWTRWDVIQDLTVMRTSGPLRLLLKRRRFRSTSQKRRLPATPRSPSVTSFGCTRPSDLTGAIEMRATRATRRA